jgi:predicted nuclease with TOPRIM domain
MNWEKLDQQLTEIVQQRNQLSQLEYSDENYDDLEEQLHDLEDEFNEEYEEVLSPELENIYSKIKSDTDVLLPTAYLANSYKEMQADAKGIVTYEVSGAQGVPVESDQLGKVDLRIVLVPNPARFVLLVNGNQLKELWKSR